MWNIICIQDCEIWDSLVLALRTWAILWLACNIQPSTNQLNKTEQHTWAPVHTCANLYVYCIVYLMANLNALRYLWPEIEVLQTKCWKRSESLNYNYHITCLVQMNMLVILRSRFQLSMFDIFVLITNIINGLIFNSTCTAMQLL